MSFSRVLLWQHYSRLRWGDRRISGEVLEAHLSDAEHNWSTLYCGFYRGGFHGQLRLHVSAPYIMIILCQIFTSFHVFLGELCFNLLFPFCSPSSRLQLGWRAVWERPPAYWRQPMYSCEMRGWRVDQWELHEQWLWVFPMLVTEMATTVISKRYYSFGAAYDCFLSL